MLLIDSYIGIYLVFENNLDTISALILCERCLLFGYHK
jgi:hypothetical protein